jgi:hypothetical protein
MPYLSYLAQALVAVVFMWAGAAKLHDVRAFARYFRELHVLPSALSGPAARGLAIVELGVGGLAAVRSTATIGLASGVVLLLALSAGIAVLLRRGATAECACFGRRSSPLGVRHLVRNGLVAVIAASGLAARTSRLAPHGPGIAVAVAVGAIGAVLIVSWDDIADLLSTPPPASKGQPHAVSRLGRGRTGSARHASVAVHVGDPAAAAKPR